VSEVDQSDAVATDDDELRQENVAVPPLGVEAKSDEPFDFDAHRQKALDAYEPRRQEFAECAQAVRSVIASLLRDERVLHQSLEARAKTAESFGRKAAFPSEDNPEKPKYPDPMAEITDLAAVRVITYLLDDVERVNEIVEREFEIVEKSTRSGLLDEGERLGYQSIHYLVRFASPRCDLVEYARFKDLVVEIQVRTILQHAWAEIEHDIQYKSRETTLSIKRRFASLAGVVEIADREFQAISTEDRERRFNARNLIKEGVLDDVEITSDALKAYLDEKYGPDGRVSEASYEWAARILKRLEFRVLGNVDQTVAPYDDDQVSRILWKKRQGQVNRFMDVLLAALGDRFVLSLPWVQADPDNAEWMRRMLMRLQEGGIPVGDFEPPKPLVVEVTPPPDDDSAES
jgi:putative GTP pyrophosphokinase